MPERLSHSFVVKVWLEETVEEANRALWRGRIVHIPGGEERYVQDLEAIVSFIARYLEEMGVTDLTGVVDVGLGQPPSGSPVHGVHPAARPGVNPGGNPGGKPGGKPG